MKYMIFEDNELSELSVKIKNEYCTDSVDVLFAGSNSGIKTLLKKHINSDDEFIIYLDMPVDNSSVFGILVSIQKLITKYNIKALIVPIPGIEYTLCKACSLNMLDWSANDIKLQKEVAKYIGKSNVSFESYLKYLAGKFCDIKSVNIEKMIVSLPTFYDNGLISVPISSIDLDYYNSLYKHLIELLKCYKDNKMISKDKEQAALVRINEFTKLFCERWR